MIFYKKKYQSQKQSALCRLLFFLSPVFLSLAVNWTLVGQTDFPAYSLTTGYAVIPEKLPEGYNYQPIFVTGRFPIHQFRSSRFRVFAEPQFAWNFSPPAFKDHFEFGANLGVQFWQPLSTKLLFSASISAGPHYFNAATDLQKKGFIFSDNFEIGIYYTITQKLYLHLKPRFRHLSNANLQKPNAGIDNFFVMIGVSWR